MVEQAVRDLEANTVRQMRERGERAARVSDWLLSLPEHARKHLFVQTYADACVAGVVAHPNTLKSAVEQIDRIVALTPEAAKRDSDALYKALVEDGHVGTG